MTDGRAARRYARALFNAARKQDIVRSVEDDLGLIATVTNGTPEFRRFLSLPSSSEAQKLSLFEKAFSDRVTATTMAFVRLVLQKRREGELGAIRHAYSELRREHEGVVRAQVTTTIELTEEERRKVVDRLTRASGKTIEAEFDVDPKLIGGIRIGYANYQLDGSVRGFLDRLRDRLIYDALKQN